MFELQGDPDVDSGIAPLSFTREDVSGALECRYAELRRLDEALRDAEQRLRAAHFVPRVREEAARKIQQLFEEVLALRTRSRQMLHDLADLWVAGD